MNDELPDNTIELKVEPKTKQQPIELTVYRAQVQDQFQEILACAVCGSVSNDPHYEPFWSVFGVSRDIDVIGYGGEVVICACCLSGDIDDLLEQRAQGLEHGASRLRSLKGRIRNPLPAYKPSFPF